MSVAVKEKEHVKHVEEKKETPEICTEIGQSEVWEIYDLKMVTGRFSWPGKPKGVLRFGPMKKYKSEKEGKRYIMTDGEVYTIPRYVADWLNGADIHDVESNPTRTPGACKQVHHDQHNDLHATRMLAKPHRTSIYSFTPLVKW